MMPISYSNVSELVTVNFENRNGGDNLPARSYRIQIVTSVDEDGVFSTVALNLPGAGSCGDTKEESIANAREAIKGVIESYIESGDSIPWEDVTADKIGDGEFKVIFVHV